MSCRIHIFGASGSGTSTLGRRLSERLDGRWLDTDAYYWLETDPPFTQKRPVSERLAMIEQDVQGVSHWVLSGSICSWGGPLLGSFTAAVYLYLPADIRMERLAIRQRERYGSRIDPGGDMHAIHQAFMDWARGYDLGKPPQRSRQLHENWMQQLTCPIIRLDSTQPVDELCGELLSLTQA